MQDESLTYARERIKQLQLDLDKANSGQEAESLHNQIARGEQQLADTVLGIQRADYG